MPSSRPNTIPTVLHLLRQLKPRSILDVGVGFGKWGHLFREYTDIQEAERDPSRYRRENWRTRIDGIEGHAAYLTPMHRYLYTDIHVGDAAEVLRKLPRYDLIFLGDVLEHFDQTAGRRVVRDAWEKCAKAVIITTPKYETGQEDLCGNDLERHRSLWSAKDLRQFEGATVKTIDGDTLLAVLARPGTPPLVCGPPRQPKPSEAGRLRVAREEILRLFPTTERFILIDDEQIRGGLGHPGAMPFLEKDGQFWGRPADGVTAIGELERLRGAGARYLAIIWSSLWWLEHYGDFHQYLRARFRVIPTGGELLVFEL